MTDTPIAVGDRVKIINQSSKLLNDSIGRLWLIGTVDEIDADGFYWIRLEREYHDRRFYRATRSELSVERWVVNDD